MTEVCSVVDVSQFAAGHSVDKCGFYSVSLLFHASKPGQAPPFNASDVASWADAEYVSYDGADVSSNGNGMVMQTLFDVLHDAGLHYQVIASTELGFELAHLTADYIRAWLKLGYPVILAVAEDNVFDLDLQGSPYAWNTAGYYHIITATGVASDGNLLVHDTASIDANGVRPGPRRYDASKLQAGLTSATAVVMSWLSRPAPDFDPIAAAQEEAMYPLLSIQDQAPWFEQRTPGDDQNWRCLQNGVILGGAHLNYFRYNGGVPRFGLPTSREIQSDATHHPEVTLVLYERGVNRFDPNYVIDKPVMDAAQPEKRVYPAKLTDADVQQKLAPITEPPVVAPTVDMTNAIAAAQSIATSLLTIEKDAATLKTALNIQ